MLYRNISNAKTVKTVFRQNHQRLRKTAQKRLNLDEEDK
nr:MAG TPA: hypothetical protein [Caudoviricetes sp.]